MPIRQGNLMRRQRSPPRSYQSYQLLPNCIHSYTPSLAIRDFNHPPHLSPPRSQRSVVYLAQNCLLVVVLPQHRLGELGHQRVLRPRLHQAGAGMFPRVRSTGRVVSSITGCRGGRKRTKKGLPLSAPQLRFQDMSRHRT